MIMADKIVYPFGQNGTLPSGYPIADDLTTNSAQQALSAKQGVVLKGLIDKKADADMKTVIPLSSYSQGLTNYINISQNVWLSDNSAKNFFVPITPGKTYVIKGNTERASIIAILKTNVVTVNTTPDYATGETSPHVLDIAGEYVFTAQADAKFLSVAKKRNNNDNTPVEIDEYENEIDHKTGRLAEKTVALEGNSWHEFFDYETASVSSTDTSKITIEKDDGKIVVTNIGGGNNYVLISIPTLEIGKTYRFRFEYDAAFAKENPPTWYLRFVKSDGSTPTTGGVLLYPGNDRVAVMDHEIDANDAALRLYASSQNNGAYVIFNKISISDNRVSLSELADKVSDMDDGSAGKEMEERIRQAKYVAESPTAQPLVLLHFSDIHGDTNAAVQIKAFAEKYASYINDLVQTGDAVYTTWDSSGRDYAWWQQKGIPEALFVIGNHDGAANSNDHGWAENGTDQDFKGKEWDFDTYFANYITTRGVTPPTGYDDSTSPYYKALYWHKDYASAKIRVIGLDCMHFNDGVRYTSNDQETWLAAKLAETLDSSNAAYKYSVVFLCHYPLDDYSGNNETWDDSAHKFVYNKNAGGGHVMDQNTGQAVKCHYGSSYTAEKKHCMRNRVGEVGNTNYTKGDDNPLGDIIQTWVNNGGKFVVWLSGHTHSEYMYYPTKFPTMLCLGMPQAGNQRGNVMADRGTDSAMHACANLVIIDSQNTILKIIRIGKTLDKNLMEFETLAFNYGTSNRYVFR